MTAHELLLASAGTGKTYQLTGRILALLVRGVEPQRILGTTFTRQSARQILDRLLARLARAADDPTELNAALGTELSAEDCRRWLGDLVRHVDRLSIQTLDAFFVQLAGRFGLEIGLPPGWRIAEEVDDERLRAEAIDRVLADVSTEEMVALLGQIQRKDVARGTHAALLRVVQEGYEIACESDAEAWERIRPPEPLADDAADLARTQLETVALPTTKAGRPRKRWENARADAVDALATERWDDFLELGLVRRVLRDEPRYDGAEIDGEFAALVRRLAGHAAHFVLGRAAGAARAHRVLLERFDEAYRGLQRERRLYRFNDVPRAFARQRGARDDGLAFRLGRPVDHLLLDEFQDTSVVQWRALAPLATSILDGGESERTFFCVGDLKQSIYGWREGEPRLMAGLDERHPSIERHVLTGSWRSSRVVLETVERVFANLSENPVFAGDEVLRAGARGWQERFGEHVARKELPGSATLVEVPTRGESRAERDGEVVRFTADHVARLVALDPRRDIGVLVRRGEPIRRLIHALRERGIHASGEGGNELTDSDAVQLAMSWLHLADHPGDRAAYFHLASSPLADELGIALHEDPEDERAAARALATSTRARLMADGYGAVLGRLQPVVDGSDAFDGWDGRRFAQLVDMAYAYDESATLRPSDFEERVRLTRVEDPTSARVKVMTVHASKGLEFDTVVLPDLDTRLVTDRGGLLRRRADPWGPIDTVFPAVKRDVAALVPELAELADDQKRRDLEEELCVLYVAMTRAERRLDMLVCAARPNQKGPPPSFATLLRNALGATAADGDGVLWRHEDSAVDEPWEGPAPAMTERAAGAAEPGLSVTVGTERFLRRRAPSSAAGGSVRPADLLRVEGAGGRLRGLLIHRWLEDIEWLEDWRADDEQLVAIAESLIRERRLTAPRDEIQAALADLRAMLSRPNTKEVLSRPRVAVSSASSGAWPGGDLFASAAEAEATEEASTVWRERRFAVRVPDDAGEECLVQGAFDRVVLSHRGGELVAAEVLDFKTDRVAGDAEIDRRVERYRPQMAEYCRALGVLTGLPADRITARILFLDGDVCRPA